MGLRGTSECGWPASASAAGHARLHVEDQGRGASELLGDVAGLHAAGEQRADLARGGIGVRLATASLRRDGGGSGHHPIIGGVAARSKVARPAASWYLPQLCA